MKSKKSWNLVDQQQFLERVCSLLKKGYTLPEAIRLLSVSMSKSKKGDLKKCLYWMSQGEAIRTCLERIKFSPDVLSYLYFAEKHGDLVFALKESTKMIERKIIQIEKVKQIGRYPLFLLFFMSIILFMIQSFIMPQFEQVYQTMNIEPSLGIQSLFIFFFVMNKSIYIVAFTGGAFLFYYKFLFKRKTAVQQATILLKIPLVKTITRRFISYYFSIQMSSLLTNGFSIYESLHLFKQQSILPLFQDIAKVIIKKLRNGEKLEVVVENSPYFDHELAIVIGYGQANSQLNRELYTYSQLLIEQTEGRFEKWSAFFQPILFIGLGAIVLMVYLSLMMPMYQMMNQV
ncbi:competence type IV pilus assembly protein ComGB [Bacillus carboniphilus]|uniref:Competence type IV pilus assembly protein ComGB n=1 Tax=Bacillus carboniphilus TaxID=86663 RepID=A0ABY9JZD1_9BACI|nr:competence type IV pilus assembly protein ComGB [Bacillus carboniphilus]WLR43922.1 competence type IV pilus assembly protein ComGB [Bacillus carboniphilus]